MKVPLFIKTGDKVRIDTQNRSLHRKSLNFMKENLILKTLRIRPFFFLIVSEFFSQFSMNLFNFALLIVVFAICKFEQCGFRSCHCFYSAIAYFWNFGRSFWLIGGIKKIVLYSTNILRALIVFPLAFFHQNLALIYLRLFGVSLVTQFFIPAETP